MGATHTQLLQDHIAGTKVLGIDLPCTLLHECVVEIQLGIEVDIDHVRQTILGVLLVAFGEVELIERLTRLQTPLVEEAATEAQPRLVGVGGQFRRTINEGLHVLQFVLTAMPIHQLGQRAIRIRLLVQHLLEGLDDALAVILLQHQLGQHHVGEVVLGVQVLQHLELLFAGHLILQLVEGFSLQLQHLL